jgi:hypothetical protein
MPNQYTFEDDNNYVGGGGVGGSTPTTTTYEFKDTSTSTVKKTTLKDRLSLRGKKSRRTNSFGSNKSSSSRSTGGSVGNNDFDDGTGSLSYSATSSINSESSFQENIIKVLQQEGHDSKEIAALLKSRKNNHHHRNYSNGGDEKSCAADSLAYSARSATSDSLAYSEEAESYMRMLAADGESTTHISQVSLLQGTALLSNGYVKYIRYICENSS